MYETIQFRLSDGIARLTLNRPQRLNSFTASMHAEVADALAQVTTQNGARVLLMTGSGRGFCAGQDLNDRAVSPSKAPADLGTSVEQYYNPLIRTLTGLEMPVICAVNGVAAGAGANIAFACDIVLAARSARFIMSFAAIGLIPDSGGTWHLPRAVGLAPAQFAWLKLVDRPLWYALHSLGFETEGTGRYLHPNPRVEALGARDHWAVECVAGEALFEPDLERAVTGLKRHIPQSGGVLPLRRRPADTSKPDAIRSDGQQAGPGQDGEETVS